MIFRYNCFNKDNVKVEGDIESVSYDQAITDLQKNGFVVISLVEKKVKSKSKSNFSFKLNFFKPRVKKKDIVIFSRQIATLFEAGVSALRAFRLLATENESLILREELNSVADSIESGVSLFDSLAKHSNVFEPFYVSMVKTGEETGKLNESFLYLADYYDRDYELNIKTKKALTYPIFVVCTFIIIMIIMFVFVIPKISEMFSENGADLPTVTKIILGISDFILSYGLYILPLILVGIWFLYKYIQTEEGHYKFDEFKINLPFLGPLYKKIFLTRLSDNLNTMLTSGVPIVRSLEITGDVVDNDIHKEILLRVSKKVENGTLLSKALYDEEYVPNILVQMVKIGEETGSLGYVLKNLANFYRREVENKIDNVVALIEPAMIVGLGLGVGILVAAVLLPMYTLSTSIS